MYLVQGFVCFYWTFLTTASLLQWKAIKTHRESYEPWECLSYEKSNSLGLVYF